MDKLKYRSLEKGTKHITFVCVIFPKYTTENLSLAAWMLAVNVEPEVDPKFHDSLSCDKDFITFGSLSVEEMQNVYQNKIC